MTDDEMSSEALVEMPLEVVERELCSWAARVTAGTCRLLLLVGEFDRRGGAETWGMVSTASWLAWRTALEPRTAREHVRVARALRDLPAVTAAFASGQLSYAKVRALTRVATAEAEAELVSLAVHATASEMESIVAAYRKSADLARSAAEVFEGRRLASGVDDEGAWRLRAVTTPEEGAVVDAALDAAVEVLRREDREASGSAEPPLRTTPQLRVDALVEVAQHYLAGSRGGAGPVDSDRYLVTISAQADDGSATVNGSAIRTETLARLCCTEPTAALLHDSAGNPLWMGRKRRHANRAQRRALVRRHDGHCAFPGCGVRSRLVPHHSEEWAAEKGRTDVDVLVPLCPFHHRCVHEGGFAVRRSASNPGRFRFSRPDGSEIPTLIEVGGSAEPPLPPAAAAAPAPGDRLPFDLDLTVDALWCLLQPADAGSSTTAA